MHRSSSASAKLGGTIVLAGLLGATLLSPGPAKAATLEPSPRGQAVVVTANLNEAFDGKDVNDTSDMELFASRLASVAPYAPDVLLLQEVSRKSSSTVAKLLSQETGHSYVAVVRPPSPLHVTYPDHVVNTETAIVINSTTMRAVGDGGYISVKYREKHKAPGTVREVRRSAYLLVSKRDGTFRVPVMSLHWVPQKKLRSKWVSWRYRSRWSRRAARFVGNKFPESRMRVISGDFNVSRKVMTSDGYRVLKWWKVMTEDYRYIDTIWSIEPLGGVDFIFAKPKLIDARIDESSPNYSDHRFRWALLDAS